MAELLKSMYDLSPDANKYVGMYAITEPAIVLRDLELIKSIALKHFDTFMDRHMIVSEDSFLGKNLSALRGDKWREVRSILSPAFTSNKMKNMFKLMSDFELPPTLPGKEPFTVKKGQGIYIPVYGLHHDPQYFQEPEKFNPERFLGEKKKQTLNCGAYLPFGLGPRMCIGARFALLETKILFFYLLARCDLKPCEKTSILSKKNFYLRKGGFWLNVSPRKNPHRTTVINVANDKQQNVCEKINDQDEAFAS